METLRVAVVHGIAAGQTRHDIAGFSAVIPDILAEVSQLGEDRPGLVIGFAAETDDVIENATAKRAQEKRGAAAAAAEAAPAKPTPAAPEPVAEVPKPAKDSGQG